VLALVLAVLLRRPELFVWTLVADGLAELASDVLKAAIPRARPHLHPLVAVPHTHSFPSGHAATSFACATVLASAVPRARLPFLLLAAAVAWSRVYVGVHYPLDVGAGALLGLALGATVSVGVRSKPFPLAAQTDARAKRARPEDGGDKRRLVRALPRLAGVRPRRRRTPPAG
jgi:membrane-associated phospholipid phosphatase